ALHEYYESIGKNELPLFRGYFLTEEDASFRKYILDISCRGTTNFHQTDLPLLEKFSFPELNKLQADGLVEWNRKEVIVTTLGLHFIRNICRVFDLHLLRNQQRGQSLFSKAI
ncbi:MAG: coproporphyrinogen III oxidase, partial [Chitinophagales bacterium]